jgi:DNA polymerase (family 10)
VHALRDVAVSRGLSLSARGLYRVHQPVGARDEQDVYAALGLPWIPPELREGQGEIEAAAAGTLPRLVTLEEIRGDLQSHTTDSDGRHSLERMAAAAESLGYEYLAVTDHSPALRIVRGLDRDGYRRQWKRIDALNSRLRSLTILKGAEVDIAEDGSLDLDDETLAGFDIVLVSMHSRFTMPPDAQTRRLVRAVSHRHVDILAHPTGRIIGRRPGAAFDVDEVFRAAADNGVMIEVNGQPDRLDLDERLVRAALEHGLRISLGTDAHSVRDLRYMRWSVDQARRGWSTSRNVANTLPLAELRDLLRGRP